MNCEVLSYGTIGLDIVLHIPHLPHPSVGTHSSGSFTRLGGKAAMCAIALAKWGIPTRLTGNAIGSDGIGQQVYALLKSHDNLDLTYLEVLPRENTMHCYVLVLPDANRALICVSSEGMPHTKVIPEMVGTITAITLDLYGGAERIEAARLARDSQCAVIIGDLRDAEHPILRFTTHAIASWDELSATGQWTDPAQFAHMALKKGPECVIVTSGSRPVRLFTPTYSSQVEVPKTAVIDTTGAGDIFRAGIVYGVIAGESLTRCIALGISAASGLIEQPIQSRRPPSLGTLLTKAYRIDPS